jgi:hypothetical protein
MSMSVAWSRFSRCRPQTRHRLNQQFDAGVDNASNYQRKLLYQRKDAVEKGAGTLGSIEYSSVHSRRSNLSVGPPRLHTLQAYDFARLHLTLTFRVRDSCLLAWRHTQPCRLANRGAMSASHFRNRNSSSLGRSLEVTRSLFSVAPGGGYRDSELSRNLRFLHFHS